MIKSSDSLYFIMGVEGFVSGALDTISTCKVNLKYNSQILEIRLPHREV